VIAPDYWTSLGQGTGDITEKRPYQYVSPDHTTFIPATEDFVSGHMVWGTKTGDVITAYGLEKAAPGQLVYVTDSYQEKTYRALVNPDGTLSDLKLFAEQGGYSVVQDREGNVYVAAGEVLVFDLSGKQIGTIGVPERPIDLLFGGRVGRTLFILTHHSLYSIPTSTGGVERPASQNRGK
jgi:sugar lactone lactonase YvrE